MDQFEAFILIGGRSSRLGMDKAMVEFGGMTLLQRAIETVQRTSPSVGITAVAGSSTQFAVSAITSDVPFIFDLHEGRGPLGGIHAALSYAKTSWIFVLACDYPFVSNELINLMAEKVSDEFGAIVAEQQDGRMQPLCGFYKVSAARPVVEEIIERPRVPPPMHEIVDQLTPRVIKFEEYSFLDGSCDLFLNINTIEDLEKAQANSKS